MKKQKEPSYITEQKPFARNLSALMKRKGSSQAELAKYVNCTRQAISKYATGQSAPDIDILVKISRFFGVSTDYLLGLTEYETVDMDIKTICEKTGLCESAVNRIATITTAGGQITGAVLNQIITNTGFLDAVYQLSEMFKLKLKRDVCCSIVLRDDWDKLVNGEKCEARQVPSSVIKDIYVTRSVKSMEKAINETITQIEGALIKVEEGQSDTTPAPDILTACE